MKKIINHKLYDTETAEAVASKFSDNPMDDTIEVLYRKKTTLEFFKLYRRTYLPNKYYDPEKYKKINCYILQRNNAEFIITLTLEQAQQWVSENCSFEEYEKIFGKVEE